MIFDSQWLIEHLNGAPDLDTLAEMAKVVAQSAGCAREEVEFTPTGRGQWIMAFYVVYPKRGE